jgi:DNA ligase-1
VYDCKLGDPAAKFSDRSRFIEENLAGLPGIVIVPTEKIDNQEMLDKYYENYIVAGNEGQIIRIDGPYENKRSKLLLKRKEFDDAEFTILGMEEGTGNRAGTVGAMHFETPKGGRLPSNGTMADTLGKPFKSNVKGSWDFVADLWVNRKKYMGKQATVRYFGLTPGDRVPRFPYVVAIRDGE